MVGSMVEILRDPRLLVGAGAILLLAVFWVGRRAWLRYRKKRTPYLEVIETKVIKPAYSSNAGYLGLRIVNTHGGRATIQYMELELAAGGPSGKPRELQPAKPVDKYDFVALLRSDRDRFKLQSAKKNPEKPVLGRAEGINYRIKLISDEYHWYRLRVVVKWRDTRGGDVHVTRSRDQYIEFAVV